MNGVTTQILVSFLISMSPFMTAVGNTWTSYSLQILESDESPLGNKITKNEASLIGSIVMLGSLTSIGFAGYLCDKIGRKRGEILCGLCYVLAWSIITTAKSVTQLLIGRYFIGLGTGLHLVCGVLYVAEISHSSIKGSLLSIMSFMYNIGATFSYVEGWFCSYDVVNYLNLTTAVLFVLALLCIQETPVYLLRGGREKEAIRALKFYRGASTITQEILDELVYMRNQIANDNKIDRDSDFKDHNEKENLNLKTANQSVTEQKSVWYILRTSKSTQRALITLIVHIVLAVSMGMIAVQAYAGQFFLRAVPNLSPHMCSVLLAIVVSITSGVTVIITDRVSRRGLMIASCLLSATCMAVLAAMMRWIWAPEWAIPLVMVLYSIFYHVAAINVPFVQIAECLSPQMSSFGTTVVMCSMFIANFVVLFAFKPAEDTLGLDGVFLLLAIIGLITALVAFLIMKETRKLPFHIVQNMFERGYLYHRCKNNDNIRINTEYR